MHKRSSIKEGAAAEARERIVQLLGDVPYEFFMVLYYKLNHHAQWSFFLGGRPHPGNTLPGHQSQRLGKCYLVAGEWRDEPRLVLMFNAADRAHLIQNLKGGCEVLMEALYSSIYDAYKS